MDADHTGWPLVVLVIGRESVELEEGDGTAVGQLGEDGQGQRVRVVEGGLLGAPVDKENLPLEVGNLGLCPPLGGAVVVSE
jgi:hypothetical protein